MTASWGYTAWALLAACTLALWGSSHTRTGARVVARPSAVVDRLATSPWLRVPLLLGWAWAGWHLFAR